MSARGTFVCQALARCIWLHRLASACRTATTVLGLNPSAEGSSGLGLAHTGRVHSSAAALVAWRCEPLCAGSCCLLQG